MGLIRQLLNQKILKILDLLLKNKNKFFHLSDISFRTNVPIGSTFRLVNKLVSLNIIETTLIGKMKIYRLSDKKETRKLLKTIKNE
jgi:DNA-binding IclR family transcriptional regulator